MAEAQRDEIAKLEALYAANPEGHVFTHLAEAYRKAGELEHARDILAEGLRRHPDSASAHVVLGRVEHDRADNAAAQRAFGQVLALDPGNLIALRFLGDLALERGDRAEALGHYRELLNRDVSDPVLQQTVDELARFAEVEAAILTPAPATAAPATSAAETAPEQGDLTEPEEGDAAGAVPGEEAVLLAAEEQAVDAGAGPVPPEPVAFESPAPAEAAELAWFAPEEPVAPALPPLEDGPEPVLATFDVVAEPLPDLETWETGEPEFLSLEFPSPEAGDLEFLSVDTDAESPEGGELAFLSLEEDDGAGSPGEYVVLEPEVGSGEAGLEIPAAWLDGEPTERAAEASAEVVGLEGEPESAAGVPEPIEDVAATGAEPFETAPAAPAAEVPAPAVEAPEVMVASGEGAEPVPAPGDEVGLVAPPEPPPETCAEPTAEPPGESFEPPVPEPTAEAAAVPEADTAAPPPAGEEPATGAVAPALDEPEAVPQFEETAGTAGPEQPPAEAEPASPPPVAESPAEAAAAPEAGPWTDAGGEPGAPESVTEGADATRAAAESELMVEAVFEAPAESPPALPELTPLGDLLSPAEAAQPPAATEAVAGLYTETMAELYRSQGFSERAAEVYRWLLARDPDNARLQALLADVGAGPASAVAAPAQRPWQPDVHAVESAFTGAAGAAAEAHTPYAWSGAGEEPAQAGPTIGAYFRQLLAWRPAAAAVPSSELLLEEVVLEPAAPEPVAPEVAAELQDVMPWELATVTEPPDAAASEAMAPDVDRAGPVAEAVPEEVPFQLLDDVTAEAPGAGAPGGEVEAEDEDLEMFRSWLQSLKK